MLQDINETIQKTINEGPIPGGDELVPRLCDTLFTFAKETVRDLEAAKWRSRFEGGLAAGYILCLLGKADLARSVFDSSMRIFRDQRDEYSGTESSALEFIVATMEEFCPDEKFLYAYREELGQAKLREEVTPQKLRQQILHIEADMECAEGDLDKAYSQGRQRQGALYQRLGEHERAIAHFRKAIEEDRRDWRGETSVPNTLSIVDSLLVLGDRESALAEFMGLIRDLVPSDLALGDALPDLFTTHFSKLRPYLDSLGLQDAMADIATFAAARLGTIEPKEHKDRAEIADMTEIVAAYCLQNGDYKGASDLYDAGRERLEYKHHLSRREQAEFAIRAGDAEKAEQLIAEEEKDAGFISDRDEKVFELVNLDLQLGKIGRALDRLDGYCENYKRHLVQGSYERIFEVRRTEVAIMKGAVGQDYAQKVRNRLAGEARLNTSLEMLQSASPESYSGPQK